MVRGGLVESGWVGFSATDMIEDVGGFWWGVSRLGWLDEFVGVSSTSIAIFSTNDIFLIF